MNLRKALQLEIDYPSDGVGEGGMVMIIVGSGPPVLVGVGVSVSA
jgi:hypothetical protein